MQDDSTDRPILALFLRLAGIAAIASMGALIKVAGNFDIELIEIIFWRQVATVPVVVIWVLSAGGFTMLATRRPGAHVFRSACGLTGMALNFAALLMLPLAEATTLSFSAPIFAVILSVLLLGERVHKWRWGAVAAGFAGVVIIAQPGGGDIPLVGAALGLAGAFMIALIAIQVRDLTRTEHPMTIVFWFSVLSVVCIFPFMLIGEHPHNTAEIGLLAAIGFVGTTGQILITLALRYGNVSSVIVMDYTGLVWATILGWLLFAELPPLTTWIGAPLVIVAGLIIAWREQAKARARIIDLRSSAGT